MCIAFTLHVWHISTDVFMELYEGSVSTDRVEWDESMCRYTYSELQRIGNRSRNIEET
jgi:hypothetical protein